VIVVEPPTGQAPLITAALDGRWVDQCWRFWQLRHRLAAAKGQAFARHLGG